MLAAVEAPPSEHAAIYARAHGAIAAFFGITNPSRLLLTSSCTQALALMLGDLPWVAGDVVITSSLEHHALLRVVQKLVHERGVEHMAAPWLPGQPIEIDAVRAALRSGRVRLIAVTGASNVTGEVLPLADLAALARAHGALLLLDSAQLAGVLPCDVEALGVDLLAFAGHKGMQGPLGIGGCWAAPTVGFHCPTASCEVRRDDGARGASAFGPFPGFCDVGSVNLPAAAGLAAGLEWLTSLPANQRERSLQLAATLRAELRSQWPELVLGGDGPHTATLSLRLDAATLRSAEAHFATRGIVVRAGQHCAPMALAALHAPLGCLRISFGPSNREEDGAVVLAAVQALLATT
jgi:cysteine desulfurase / selenocysteine lyase